jgi:hypothetical protein
LKQGKTYCVRFFVNICSNSSYGMDRFEAYFGDNSIDTITKTSVPLTYLIPQIQNSTGNLVTDTLGWTLISGTFVATGTEKHMIIGNFKSDAATNTVLINSANLPAVATDVCIDDVSCIDVDLPAYAGPDTSCIAGTSVYIGRQRDVGIDEACIWYKLPNTTTSIDTAAGIWVSPTSTSSFVVKQEICGNVKWDTIVVYEDHVGIGSLELIRENLNLLPVPATDNLTLTLTASIGDIENSSIFIRNSFGLLIKEEKIIFRDGKALLDIKELPNGFYFLTLQVEKVGTVSKRFIVVK